MNLSPRLTASCLIWVVIATNTYHVAGIAFDCATKSVMSDGQTYVVSAGTYNCSQPVMVYGNSKLQFEDQDITIILPGLVIEDGGIVEIGTSSTPIATGTITLKFWGSWTDACLPSSNSYYSTANLFCPANAPYCSDSPSCGVTSANCPDQTQIAGVTGSTSCGGPYGIKAIAVGTGGTLDIHGNKGVPGFPSGLQALNITGAPDASQSAWRTGTSWAILTKTLLAGQSTAQCLVTDRPLTTWAIGDEVVMTTTDFEPAHNERVKLVTCPAGASCSSGLCVGLLKYKHSGGYQKTSNNVEIGQAASARVGLISRRINIIAIGNTSSEDPLPLVPYNYMGVQIIVRGGATGFRMEGAKVQWGGQGGLIGRYAIHFHFLGLDGAQGMYIHGNSIVDSFTRAAVIHQTRFVTISENVAHKSIGQMFYIETGQETMNALVNNLGVEAISGTDFGQYNEIHNPTLAPGIHDQFDCTKPSLFWIPNPHNVFQGNQAIGAYSVGAGYWAFGSLAATKPVGVTYPLDGSPWANQLSNFISFDGNHASAVAFCVHNEGSTGVDKNAIYPPTGNGFTCLPNPRSTGIYIPLSGAGTIQPIVNPNGVSDGRSDRFSWSMQVVENFECVRARPTQSFGTLWLRGNPAMLVSSIMVDNLSRGPTIVSGGSPTVGSGAFYNAFLSNITAVGTSAFYPCVDTCCNAFDQENGIWWPMGDVAMQRSAVNFYDGPVHMTSIHVENYTDGLKEVFCNTQPKVCNGGNAIDPLCTSSSPWWTQGPSIAMSWMLPNAQYYPTTFTSSNFSFTTVQNRHIALSPWQKLVRTLGNIPYNDIGHGNLLTVVQDLDGSLTGAKGSQGQPVASTTSTRFLRSPNWRIECLASETCGISSSRYASMFLQPLTQLSFFNNTENNVQAPDSINYWSAYTAPAENVALYRLSLGAKETSIPGLGLWDINRPVGNQMEWASLLVNTSNALVFTQPLKVWSIFMTNIEERDWVELAVPVKPGGQVKIYKGFIRGRDIPVQFFADEATTTTLTPNANGIIRVNITANYPLKEDECWLPAICGPFPACNYQGLPYSAVSPSTNKWLEDACQLGKKYAFESLDYLPDIDYNKDSSARYDPFFLAISIQGDLDETFDWNKLTQETRPFVSSLQDDSFNFLTGDDECAGPANTPVDLSKPPLTLCPSDWKNYGTATINTNQWNEMVKFDCNRWDWNTSTEIVTTLPPIETSKGRFKSSFMDATGNVDGNFTFNNVLVAGFTVVTIVSPSDPNYIPPAGFQLTDPPVYVDIMTTVPFEGPFTICLDYPPNSIPVGAIPQLLHYINNHWEDITTTIDFINRNVCGETDHLSPFAVGYGFPRVMEDGLQVNKVAIKQLRNRSNKDQWELKATFKQALSSNLSSSIIDRGVAFEISSIIEGGNILLDTFTFAAGDCKAKAHGSSSRRSESILCKNEGSFNTASFKFNHHQRYQIQAKFRNRDLIEELGSDEDLQVGIFVPDASVGTSFLGEVQCSTKTTRSTQRAICY